MNKQCRFALLLLVLIAQMAPGQIADAASLAYVEAASGARSASTRELIQWTHTRLVFNKDLKRVAVGQNRIMDVEILSAREVLVLAKNVGRTSLMVWYADEASETFVFGVTADLSVLRHAIRDVHPAIRVHLAPDRAALVLGGTVPTVRYRVAAERAATDYLRARNSVSPMSGATLSQGITANLDTATAALDSTSNQLGDVPAIINLIHVDQQPLSTEEKLEAAIQELGGSDVTVQRLIRGDVEDDALDTLLLGGKVRTQVELVRILNVAAQLFVGSDGARSIRILANESGSVLTESARDFDVGAIGSAGSAPALNNNLQSNVGRAKMLSIANGRILSTIEVTDLPQVRVSVQLHEVNRSRLKNWRSDTTAVSNGFRNESITPGGGGLAVQPDASERVGATGWQIENALQLLGGGMSNQLQVGGTDLAFDALFSLLEREGISRTLSRPTMTVLAGESALFQVGGEVPVPSAYSPTGFGGDNVATASGVFSGTEFKAFGVQLTIRPMVDEHDNITLDVRPSISMPDNLLTQSIASSTGSALNTTAFNSRTLETTARLQDGQPLVIGGLLSRNISDDQSYTPGLHRVPVVGALAKSSGQSDTDMELVVVVIPTIVREPSANLPLWSFRPASELLPDFAAHAAENNGRARNRSYLRGEKQ